MTKTEVLLTIPHEIITNKIFFIRGQKVMLDSDLAELYEVEARVLNQAVNRNEYRFHEDFKFKLSEEEWNNLKSQFVTSSWGGRRKLPFVFTEHGVLMLSSVLNSRRAIDLNILIMRVFSHIRKMLTENTELRLAIEKLEKKSDNHSKNIELVFKYLDELLEKKENNIPRKSIGYKLPNKKS
ncbi:MAG: ORF6N domain-containing protein [Bacteroidota bacterium]|nr:ORF6N domain-containing protein [Bacteroidota bacterium]MDP3144391.1 ORF6N domain-containing protein [Bacteroidota bacterium]MDP3555931.1 ORF6N domain-containing protein [Bacteroidota bacterium]